MAVTCPVDFDTARLRAAVGSVYSGLAADPGGDFHFHRGADYATGFLGYDRATLAELPRSVVDRFACFSGTSAERKLGGNLWIGGANIFARKPR